MSDNQIQEVPQEEINIADRILGLTKLPEGVSFDPVQRAYFENTARRMVFAKARLKLDLSNPIEATNQLAYYEAAIDIYLTLADMKSADFN